MIKAIECDDCVIDGFYISGARAYGPDGMNDDPLDRRGGGVLQLGGSLTIRHCVIENNSASYGGGGLYVDEQEGAASLIIQKTSFRSNSAEEGTPANGGGIYNGAAYLQMDRSEFLVHHCLGSGGAIFNPDNNESAKSTVLNNVLFYITKADVAGGAVYSSGDAEASVTMTNCTVHLCTAGDGAGGVHTVGDDLVVTITSSIFAENLNYTEGTPYFREHEHILGGDLTVDYTDVWITCDPTPCDIVTGTDNINANPMFDSSLFTFARITMSSPCVNAGDPAGVPWDKDLDDGLRIVGGRIDMGVNEPQVGACCEDETCTVVLKTECDHYVCDLNDLLGPYDGCYGDVDGNNVVNAADRGYVSAAIGQTAFHLVCNFDMDGNGVINAADRGFISAEIGLCNSLPDWQNGSGANNGVFPDPRFPYFFGVDTVCEEVECEPESMMMGGGESYSYLSEESEESASLWLSEASGGWYGLEVSGITIEGAVILGATDEDAAVFEASGVTESVIDLSTLFANPIPAVLFGPGYTRHDMLMLDSLSVSGEICQVRAAQGATLRLEVYVWRTVNGAIETYAAAITE